MGLINNDVFEAPNGVQKAGTYLSFSNETISLQKNKDVSIGAGSSAPVNSPNTVYSVEAKYRIFWDKDARKAGKAPIDIRMVSIQLSEQGLQANLYHLLYEELKKIYPHSTDDQDSLSLSLITPEPAGGFIARPPVPLPPLPVHDSLFPSVTFAETVVPVEPVHVVNPDAPVSDPDAPVSDPVVDPVAPVSDPVVDPDAPVVDPVAPVSDPVAPVSDPVADPVAPSS